MAYPLSYVEESFSSGILRSCGYLFLAPDMDAKPFMDDAPVVQRPAPVEWITASCKFLWNLYAMVGCATSL